MRQRVELARYSPGEVIFNQGDLADAFYLVRIGFVKVTEKYPGGELVLAYLSKGNYFGEIGLMGGGKRTATCSALDHVEVVRISSDDFKEMLHRFPDIRAHLERHPHCISLSLACGWSSRAAGCDCEPSRVRCRFHPRPVLIDP